MIIVYAMIDILVITIMFIMIIIVMINNAGEITSSCNKLEEMGNVIIIILSLLS